MWSVFQKHGKNITKSVAWEKFIFKTLCSTVQMDMNFITKEKKTWKPLIYRSCLPNFMPVFPDMCGCHGNAWHSSFEKSMFHKYVTLVLCAKFHANRVNLQNLNENEIIFPPICVVAMATLGLAVPKIPSFPPPCNIGPVCQISCQSVNRFTLYVSVANDI